MVSSFLKFLDHTQRRTTNGRIPLDEWSACSIYLYLTTHNNHSRQTSMPPVGFKPTISAGELPQTYALGRAATGTGCVLVGLLLISWFISLFIHSFVHSSIPSLNGFPWLRRLVTGLLLRRPWFDFMSIDVVLVVYKLTIRRVLLQDLPFSSISMIHLFLYISILFIYSHNCIILDIHSVIKWITYCLPVYLFN